MLEALDLLRGLSDDLSALVRGLSDAQWNAETNCPPWTVRQLAAHVVSSGEGFVDSIHQGLAGSLVPSKPAEVRVARHAALESASPGEIADALDDVTRAFISAYDGLDETQLETICFHRRGNRSIRWYASHRLAEVAFHGWDLRTSLGLAPDFDDHVAELLLPTLLQSNAPRTYAAGLSAERGNGESYRLTVASDASASWLIRIWPKAISVGRRDGDTDVTIEAPADAMALLVYGRADLTDPRFEVKGDPDIASRFSRVFPRP